MSDENKMSDTIRIALEKFKEIAGTDMVIGNAITLGEGITAIPVSKLSFGFGSGGTDLPEKEGKSVRFGGGVAGGISMTPLAFLVSDAEGVRILHVDTSKASAAENIIKTVPELIDKLSATFKKPKKEETES
ncbi:MAG: sporulation protein YtfJ [Ruminococcaceae bacterium]|jgi:sporulation protein YtfJ|nr:sporulation protein YtfJ [Oscillospiraceae bacterium]